MVKMKYFYDTEFHEDGQTIDLISIGIVREDGRSYYAVSSEADYRRVHDNSWLMNNVMDSIPYVVEKSNGHPYDTIRPVGPTVKSRRRIRDDIVKFVGNDSPEFWAWYADYDHVALCQLFGKMIDLPHNFPMFTRDLRQHWEYRGCPPLPKQTEGKHNALDDARHNLIMYNYMESS
ncbi:DnaQ-like DNA polymerase III subunit [Streptomyces phage Moab]|nr:DnaQ-like DNA polymerase III subunit [Streptomyces phage Moab]WMI33739.1 DnaQ-like DNA polymerase III subunit [Streptomyces phage Patelgo]